MVVLLTVCLITSSSRGRADCIDHLMGCLLSSEQCVDALRTATSLERRELIASATSSGGRLLRKLAQAGRPDELVAMLDGAIGNRNLPATDALLQRCELLGVVCDAYFEPLARAANLGQTRIVLAIIPHVVPRSWDVAAPGRAVWTKQRLGTVIETLLANPVDLSDSRLVFQMRQLGNLVRNLEFVEDRNDDRSYGDAVLTLALYFNRVDVFRSRRSGRPSGFLQRILFVAAGAGKAAVADAILETMNGREGNVDLALLLQIASGADVKKVIVKHILDDERCMLITSQLIATDDCNSVRMLLSGIAEHPLFMWDGDLLDSLRGLIDGTPNRNGAARALTEWLFAIDQQGHNYRRARAAVTLTRKDVLLHPPPISGMTRSSGRLRMHQGSSVPDGESSHPGLDASLGSPTSTDESDRQTKPCIVPVFLWGHCIDHPLLPAVPRNE